jgi:hypothetical protein
MPAELPPLAKYHCTAAAAHDVGVADSSAVVTVMCHRDAAVLYQLLQRSQEQAVAVTRHLSRSHLYASEAGEASGAVPAAVAGV